MTDELTPFEQYLANALESEPVPPMAAITAPRRRTASFLRGRLVVMGLSTAALTTLLGGTALAVATAVHVATPPAPPHTAAPATVASAAPVPTTLASATPHPAQPNPTTVLPQPAGPVPSSPPIQPPAATSAPSGTAPPAQPVSIISAMSLTPTSFHNDGKNYTMVRWTLTAKASVDLTVLDSSGHVVNPVLTHDIKDVGDRSQGYWGYNGSGKLLSPGTYTVRLTATPTAGGAASVVTRQLVLT